MLLFPATYAVSNHPIHFPGPSLLHHVLAVSQADSTEDDIIQTNVAGFIVV